LHQTSDGPYRRLADIREHAEAPDEDDRCDHDGEEGQDPRDHVLLDMLAERALGPAHRFVLCFCHAGHSLLGRPLWPVGPGLSSKRSGWLPRARSSTVRPRYRPGSPMDKRWTARLYRRFMHKYYLNDLGFELQLEAKREAIAYIRAHMASAMMARDRFDLL